MKNYIWVFLILFSSIIFAQESIYVEYDPSTIAFGNSSVANIYSQMPAESNPALLTEQKGISVFYTQRNIDWWTFTRDMHYSSIGSSLETSFGSFAITYKRFSMGEISYVGFEYPEPISKGNLVDYSLSISYAKRLYDFLSVGLTLKTFKHDYELISGQDIDYATNFPVAADFGILFSYSFFDDFENKLFAGASIQNVGTEYTLNKKYIDNPIGGITDNVMIYPKTFKIGLACLIKPFNYENISPLSLFFTAGLKTTINDISYSEDEYKSLGLDINIFEIFSFRIGGVIYDKSTGCYGKENVLNWRYGFGININPQKLSVDIPVSLSFNYSWIPLDLNNVYAIPGSSILRENLDAFNITLSYNNSIF